MNGSFLLLFVSPIWQHVELASGPVVAYLLARNVIFFIHLAGLFSDGWSIWLQRS